MSGRRHKGLRRLADQALQRVPSPPQRRRTWWRRLLDWCQGRQPRPAPDRRRLARRNVKSQYRRWRDRRSRRAAGHLQECTR